MGRELPLPGDWDDPQPCTAPRPDTVEAVAALNLMRDRIPQLIEALGQVHSEIPGLLVRVLTGDVPQEQWRALAALCAEPGQILVDLAKLCRQQAGH
jgi:hypothetical protein